MNENNSYTLLFSSLSNKWGAFHFDEINDTIKWTKIHVITRINDVFNEIYQVLYLQSS